MVEPTAQLASHRPCPCGCNIAVRVRPHMGLHEGWSISCGMGRRHGRDIPREMTMRVSLFPSVHFCLQVPQINELARLRIIRNTYMRCKGYSFHVSTCI